MATWLVSVIVLYVFLGVKCSPTSLLVPVICKSSVCVCVLLATSEETSCEFGSAKYYALCGFGGILSCGITHTAVVPLDLVKCRIQVCMWRGRGGEEIVRGGKIVRDDEITQR